MYSKGALSEWAWIIVQFIGKQQTHGLRWLEFCDIASGNCHWWGHKSMDKVGSNTQVDCSGQTMLSWFVLGKFPQRPDDIFSSIIFFFPMLASQSQLVSSSAVHPADWSNTQGGRLLLLNRTFMVEWWNLHGFFLDKLISLHNLEYFHKTFRILSIIICDVKANQMIIIIVLILSDEGRYLSVQLTRMWTVIVTYNTGK